MGESGHSKMLNDNYYFTDQMVNELLAQAEATAKMFRRDHEAKPERTTLARVHELAQAVVTATKSLNTIYEIMKKETWHDVPPTK